MIVEFTSVTGNSIAGKLVGWKCYSEYGYCVLFLDLGTELVQVDVTHKALLSIVNELEKGEVFYSLDDEVKRYTVTLK